MRVILAGLVVTATSALMAAVAPDDGGVILFLALFLLGYGWNLGFVAGSTLLTTGLGLAERTRVEGLTDALIWSSAAAASLGSGVVVAARQLHRARAARCGAHRRPGLAAPEPATRDGIGGGGHGLTELSRRAELPADPGREHPGTVRDLGQRDVLVGAVGDPHVARTEDDARRRADVDEHLHVGAVRLAEERGTPAGHGLDRLARDRPAAGGRTGPGPTRTGRR